MAIIDEIKMWEAYQARQKDCYGVTLAAYFQEDPSRFKEFIKDIQNQIMESLGENDKKYFEPYPLKNIHATMGGLEGRRMQNGEILNGNLAARLRGILDEESIPTVVVEDFLRFLREGFPSMEIQIGGFNLSDWNPYDPDRSPYNRAFDIQNNGLFVMMGWPCQTVDDRKYFLPLLLGMRKHFEAFNIVHKYHVVPSHGDNDLFFVIGSLNPEVWKAAGHQEKERIQKRLDQLIAIIRQRLAANGERIPLTIQNLKIIAYTRTTLSQTTDAKSAMQVTPDKMRSLYKINP